MSDIRKKLLKSPYSWSIGLHVLFVIGIMISGSKRKLIKPETPQAAPTIRIDVVDLPDKMSKNKKTPSKPKEVITPKAPTPKAETLDKDDELKVKKETVKKVITKKTEEKKDEPSLPKTEVIKGNKLEDGTSLTGIKKLKFNKYQAEAYEKIQQNWTVPNWFEQKDYKTLIRVFINSKGVLYNEKIEKSSGSTLFDKQALKAVELSSPLPKPPDDLKAWFQAKGVLLSFP